MIAGLVCQYAVASYGPWYLVPGMFIDGLGMGMAITGHDKQVVTGGRSQMPGNAHVMGTTYGCAARDLNPEPAD
jgi:hypothetical protein